MRQPKIIQEINRKLVLNDRDIEILAEYEKQRFFGRVEREQGFIKVAHTA